MYTILLIVLVVVAFVAFSMYRERRRKPRGKKTSGKRVVAAAVADNSDYGDDDGDGDDDVSGKESEESGAGAENDGSEHAANDQERKKFAIENIDEYIMRDTVDDQDSTASDARVSSAEEQLRLGISNRDTVSEKQKEMRMKLMM